MKKSIAQAAFAAMIGIGAQGCATGATVSSAPVKAADNVTAETKIEAAPVQTTQAPVTATPQQQADSNETKPGPCLQMTEMKNKIAEQANRTVEINGVETAIKGELKQAACSTDVSFSEKVEKIKYTLTTQFDYTVANEQKGQKGDKYKTDDLRIRERVTTTGICQQDPLGADQTLLRCLDLKTDVTTTVSAGLSDRDKTRRDGGPKQ